jgi:DDE superfamily endonuclease
MPPHSSHLLQLLDVSCFSLLKRAYGSRIKQFTQARVNHIDKADFLVAYNSARKEAFTASTIQSGFAGAGLVLYDPNRVLAKFGTQLQTPSPASDI